MKGPTLFSGVVFILDEPFPIYRLFLAGAGIVVALAIWQFLERTRLGLLIRATSQNAEMVHALGTDVNLVRSGVFGIGCGLAALGGVLAAPLVTASLGMAASVIIDAFVIVIIGGMGSFPGSLIGALLVAFVQVFGNLLFPGFGAGIHVLDHAGWCWWCVPAGCWGRKRDGLNGLGALLVPFVWRSRRPACHRSP